MGADPITAPRLDDGFIGFMNAALGLRGFFGAAAFFATFFAAFFAGAFFAALAAGFFAAGFFAADFFAAGFFAAFFFAVAIYDLQTVEWKMMPRKSEIEARRRKESCASD